MLQGSLTAYPYRKHRAAGLAEVLFRNHSLLPSRVRISSHRLRGCGRAGGAEQQRHGEAVHVVDEPGFEVNLKTWGSFAMVHNCLVLDCSLPRSGLALYEWFPSSGSTPHVCGGTFWMAPRPHSCTHGPVLQHGHPLLPAWQHGRAKAPLSVNPVLRARTVNLVNLAKVDKEARGFVHAVKMFWHRWYLAMGHRSLSRPLDCVQSGLTVSYLS